MSHGMFYQKPQDGDFGHSKRYWDAWERHIAISVEIMRAPPDQTEAAFAELSPLWAREVAIMDEELAAEQHRVTNKGG